MSMRKRYEEPCASAPPGSLENAFVSHDSTRRRRLGDHRAVLLPDGSARR